MTMPEGPHIPETPRSGFLGFLTSLPGILTAFAAVLTAVGGIVFAVNQGDSKAGGTPSPQTSTTPVSTQSQTPPPGNLTKSGGRAPVDVTVTFQTLRLGNAPADTNSLPSQGSDGSAEQLINACSEGDENACVTIIKDLVYECEQGYGVSCDVLYEISPVGSDLETFGATCGLRLDADVADTCSEQ